MPFVRILLVPSLARVLLDLRETDYPARVRFKWKRVNYMAFVSNFLNIIFNSCYSWLYSYVSLYSKLRKYFPLLEVRIFKQNHYFIAEWHTDAVNPSKRAPKIIKKNKHLFTGMFVRLRFKYNYKLNNTLLTILQFTFFFFQHCPLLQVSDADWMPFSYCFNSCHLSDAKRCGLFL